MNKNSTYRYLFLNRVKKNWYRVLASIISGAVRGSILLLPPYFIRNIVNSLSTEIKISYIIKSASFTILIPLVVLVLYVIDAKISKYIFDIVKDIRYASMENIMSQKLRWILTKNKNELYNKTITSTSQLSKFYYYTLSNLAWYTATAVVGTYMILSINVYIAIVLLLLSVLQVAITVIRGKVTMKVTEEKNKVKERGDSDFNNIIQFNSFIKVGLLHEQELKNHQDWRATSWENSKNIIRNFVISDSMTFIVVAAKSIVLYLLAHYFFVRDAILAGDVLALNTYAVYLTPIFWGLQDWIVDLYKARVNQKRVNTFLSVEPQSKVSTVKPANSISSIDVRNISFDYSGDHDKEGALLKNISFNLKKGTVLYIIGPSGSGKSTLINILTNIEEGHGGQILYNRIDLRKIDDSWVHKNVVCVSQENEIMSTTLRDNLLFSGKPVEENEILNVLEELQMTHLVKSVPDGLDWDMRRNPRLLSDGEKKRLSIARALLANPQVLILDEPTAGLDSINKQKIIDNIRNRMKDKILIVITHDKIYDVDSNALNFGEVS